MPDEHERILDALCALSDRARAIAAEPLADGLLALMLVATADRHGPTRGNLARLADVMTATAKEMIGEDRWRDAVEEDDELSPPSAN